MFKNAVAPTPTPIYREYLDIAEVVILTTNDRAEVTLINKKGCSLLGYQAGEIIGRNWIENFTPAEDRALIEQKFNSMMTGGIEPFKELEMSVVNKSGRRRLWSCHNSLLKDASGQIIGLLSSAEDITEQRLAEEKNEHTRALKTALDSILRISLEPVPLKEVLERTMDVVFTIPWFSYEAKGAIFLTVRDKDELSIKAERGLPGEIKDRCRSLPFGKCLCGRAAAAGKPIFTDHLDAEHEIIYKGIADHGHYCIPIISNQKVLGVICLYLERGHIRDAAEERFLSAMADTLAGIIERRRAEEALRQSEERYRSLFERSNDAIFIHDLHGSVIDVNSRAAALIGRNIGQLTSMVIFRLLDLAEKESIDIAAMENMKSSHTNFETTLTKPDGRVLYVDVSAHVVNKLHGIVQVMVHDITDRKRIEQYNFARNEFLIRLVGLTNATEVSELAFDYVRSLVSTDAGMLILLKESDPERRFEVVYSFDTDHKGQKKVDSQRRPLQLARDSYMKKVLLSGEKQVFGRSEEECRALQPQSIRAFGYAERRSRSLAFLPLLIHGQIVGAFTVQSYQPDVYDEELVALLESISADLALALKAITSTDRLSESEEKFRIMSDTAQDAIIMMDDSEKISFWNNAAEKIFGYTEKEAIGEELHALIAPAMYREEFKRGFARFKKTGQGNVIGHTLQLTARKKDGSEFPIENSVSGMRVRGYWHAVGIIRDITDQVAAHQMQARIITQYTTMLNTVPAAMYLKDAQHRYVVVNREFCHSVDREPDLIIGKTDYDIREPELAARYQKEDIVVLEEGREIVNKEERVKNADGENQWLSVVKVPLVNNEGEVAGVVGLIQDVTEQRRSRDKLVQSDKLAAIGTLAAGVAHEINNPIGYVNSNLNTMLKYLKKINHHFFGTGRPAAADAANLTAILKDFEDAVNESIEGTSRVKRIVADLKSFSRVDRAEKEYADINEGIKSTLNIVWNELKYKCQVEQDLGELPDLYCIPNQLNQVFMNLLMNAGQAITDKSGIIKIKTRADNNNIVISIKDNGSGIPENNLKKIFEPFYTTKEVGKGTGLGLSLVFDIVKKHKGTIDVNSELGVGTEFIVTLPLEGIEHV